jgi:nucleotide-binding universal stress UspA family protein
VDFSAHSDRALRYAAVLAGRFNATVELLHVVEDPFVTGAWASKAFVPNIPELMDTLVADARRRLVALKTSTTAANVRLEASILTGEPAGTIVEHARAGAFDLIVMGTHGRTGLTHMFVGSVAERVVRTATCPVLTVQAVAPATERDAAPADAALV